jgi:DNA-binding LytR/AlgR family response regulator
MTRSEISASSEVYEIDHFIPVRRWVVGPDPNTTGTVKNDGPPVLLARWAVVFVRVEGHLLHLHTVAGDEYVRRGTLKSLEQRWAKYDLVRIHNRYLVFLPHVRELRQEPDGPAKVFLRSGADAAPLAVSQQRLPAVEQLWEAHLAQCQETNEKDGK